MTTEVEQAVQAALAQKEAADKREQEAKAADVTGGTWFWAIVIALLIPIAGVIYGIVNLVQGKANKGWLYIGVGVVGWIISAALMSSM